MALFVCNECEKPFSGKARLATHLRLHYRENITTEMEQNKKKGKSDFGCKLCSEQFASQLHLEKHIQLIHKRKAFRCNVCSFSSNRKDNLTNHEISKHRPELKEHRCPHCWALFATKCNLQNHQLMHTRLFPVSCRRCGKGFRSERDLKRHLPTHKRKAVSVRKKQGVKCDKCPEVFSQRDFLEQHVAKKHGKASKKFPCEECQFSTDRKNTLKRHWQRKHLNGVEKRYKCEECGKAFESLSLLQRHGSVHSKQKPFACTACGKSFSRKNLLSRHDHSVHKKQRPYICGDCGKTFSTKWNLCSHKEAKKGEKVKCERCGEQYVNKESLRSHLHRIHGDQPWYKCQYCPMGVTTKWSLKRHEERHRSKPKQID